VAEEQAKANALPAIVENLNRLDVDTESAKDIDEAILILRCFSIFYVLEIWVNLKFCEHFL